MNAPTFPSTRGQGALEYLLLIGGAVLIATIVLVIIVGSSQSTNTIISNNLSTSDVKVQNAFNAAAAGLGGGPAASLCGNNTIDAGEQCDGTASFAATCYSQGYSVGTLGCNSSCQFDTSTACSGPGPFIINGPPTFSSGNVTLNVTVPGDNGQVGVLPYFTILYLRDNAIPGGACAAFANTVATDPATAINNFVAVALNPSVPAAGTALTNLLPPPGIPNTTATPGTIVPLSFPASTFTSINVPGTTYCFAIAGVNGAAQVGVPTASALITI
ncbi:MAG: class III signal peptide-containing protein [Candidatus Iainarchaeum archaeon]|uniref:Class III signal peptide-containing protein n=1 Tax=Candidatus Iainarchaeum sp. TaxID=3101447 RepID=A0A7T9DJN0_9ARCH|nr:MAG: class III signal peptide-containing protein [Candidatus Diapherotrites archaeon]